MQHLVGRTPEAAQQSGTRWQLATLRAACTWLQGRSLAGVSRVLRRCHLSLKRSRDHLRSPDPHYVAKLADIVRALEESAASAGRVVVVFLDEFTFYRQPTASVDWCRAHKTVQPLAQRAQQSNTTGRIIAALNALTGAVTARVVSKTTTTQVVRCWQDLRAQYPDAAKIYVVLDNWPVHFHPEVLAALEPQQTRWELKTPSNWASLTAKPRATGRLPLQLLPLPTYASWCNPIEKLWRKLQQEVLHLHCWATQWDTLKEKIQAFLDHYREASPQLLRYVGLTANSQLYGALFAAQARPPS